MTYQFAELFAFVEKVVIAAGALAVLLLLHWMLRHLAGWRWGASLVGVFHALIDWITSGSARELTTLNLEFRDSAGKQMDLPGIIRAVLRNGHGHPVRLIDGLFLCDTRFIEPGMTVIVTVQGALREELVVQIDGETNVPFVKSRFERRELLDLISRGLVPPTKPRRGLATSQSGA